MRMLYRFCLSLARLLSGPRHLLAPCLSLGLSLGLLLAPAALVSADEGSGWQFGIALGHGKRLNPMVASDDFSLNAVVDIAWYGERFFFDNGDFGFTLKEDQRYSLNLVATVNNERNYYSWLGNRNLGVDLLGVAGGDRVDDDGNPIPGPSGTFPFPERQAPTEDGLALTPLFFDDVDSSLPKRRFALNSGLEFLYLTPWGDFQAQALTDVSGVHRGQELWLSYTYPWQRGANEFAFSMGAEWKSARLSTYYYGVEADEVIPYIRPAYATGATFNPYFRLAAGHSFNDNWKLVSVVERQFLDSALRNSPVVERSTVDTFFIGLFYRFQGP